MTAAVPRSRQRTRPGKPSRRERRAEPAPDDGALGILESQARFFLRHAQALQRRLEEVAADPTRADEIADLARQVLDARKCSAQFASSALQARSSDEPSPERVELRSDMSPTEAVASYLRIMHGATYSIISACCDAPTVEVLHCRKCGSACDHKPAAPKPVEAAAQTPAAPSYQESQAGIAKESAPSAEVEIEPEIARPESYQAAPPREVPPPPKRNGASKYALVAKLKASRRQSVFFK